MSHKKWDSAEKIVRAYEELRLEIGRVPTQEEFIKGYGGAVRALRIQRLVPGVKTWNDFVRYMGDSVNCDINKWGNAKKIISAYQELKQELRRVPVRDEFKKKYGGALGAIERGKVIKGVTTWNEFLKDMGDTIYHSMKRWNTEEKIIQAYENYKSQLGREPTYDEFQKRYAGALSAITTRNVIPNVKNWNSFLVYMGERIRWDMKKWGTPEKITQAYDELKREFGRTPTQDEFGKKYGGALGAITRKKIIPNVTSWRDFIIYMGDKPHRQRKNIIPLLESLLSEDSKDKPKRREIKVVVSLK